MHVVLGGIPQLADIVGRERECAEVLESFSGHGALLTGDRRHGKTSLTRLVEAACKDAGHQVVRVSAERSSFADFVEALAEKLAGTDSAYKQAISGWHFKVKAGPVVLERDLATRSLDLLVRAAVDAHRDGLLVLTLDEIPVLAKAMEGERPGSGAEMLHLLRRLRQDYPQRLVMVLSGSIGFHHVTQDALGATNDIAKVPVGPLLPADAVFLARCLLLGEQVTTSDEYAVGVAIATEAEGVPYYVHHLVKAARRLGTDRDGPVKPYDIAPLVDDALHDPDDPWDLRHYRDRIPSYYGAGLTPLVIDVLDVYAARDDPVSLDDVLRRLAAVREDVPSRQQLIALIERLEADHYLSRVGPDSRFASNLVRRAWLALQRR